MELQEPELSASRKTNRPMTHLIERRLIKVPGGLLELSPKPRYVKLFQKFFKLFLYFRYLLIRHFKSAIIDQSSVIIILFSPDLPTAELL